MSAAFDVRFTPKATTLLRRRELSLWADAVEKLSKMKLWN
jgi:hypothetical protein